MQHKLKQCKKKSFGKWLFGARRFWGILMVLSILLASLMESPGGSLVASQAKAAAKASTKSAKIRLVFTSDIHGQLTTTNYETGKSYTKGGLARAYTLIKNARKTYGEANTWLFDIGDTMYDTSTEYIWQNDPDTIQPVYRAMATMDYDAITLGNHDFDYGFSYIQSQLKGAELSKKVVVSNVYDAGSGEPIWAENKIITKEVEATDGSKVSIKIGIVGETIPKLSSKYSDYKAVLATEDIVANTKKQAAALKAKGADLVVVLAHSGFGIEVPEEMEKNVSYALTKIPEVDVVLCGHQHKVFPSQEAASAEFYKLPGVSKSTGLVNGKNLVMAPDRGKGIGVVDLTVKKQSDGVSISKRNSDVWLVAEKNPAADKSLNDDFMGKWKDEILATYTNTLGVLEYGLKLQNYFGLIDDSAALQLANNSMIQFAMDYVNKTGTQYKDLPIIAAAKYKAFGQEDRGDYIDISGDMMEADAGKILNYNGYINLYTISGKQLREWLEWSASAYTTAGNRNELLGKGMTDYVNSNGLCTLLGEEYQDDWGSFYVFDGVEYVIDTSVNPRYNRAGQKVNDTKRITSLTLNGEPVSDNQKFLLACNRITETNEALAGLTTQTIKTGYNRCHTIFINYLKQLNKTGSIYANVDRNWRVSMPSQYSYVVMSGEDSASTAVTRDWYEKTLGVEDGYVYYQMKTPDKEDKNGPNIVLTPMTMVETNNNIKVLIQSNDESGVQEVRYIFGKFTADNVVAWYQAAKVDASNSFEASVNGVYTVMAMDGKGNRSVSYINVDNINRGVLQAPTVATYTNRKSKISGTAEPGSKIFFEVGDGTIYESQVDASGKFSYALPNQKAGTTVLARVQDDTGRVSANTTVTVKRTGPNYPTVKAVKNTVKSISGNTNDSNVKLAALIGDKVYVAKDGGSASYQKSEIYSDGLKIVPTTVTISKSGSFTMSIPAQRSSAKVKLYTIDNAGRASRAVSKTVKESGPNMPTIFAVCDAENQVSGRVYRKSQDRAFDVTVSVDDQEYTGQTDGKGYYTIKTKNLSKDTRITVYAEDTTEDGTVRKSASNSYQVKDVNQFVEPNGDLTIAPITDKVFEITGNYSEEDCTVYLKVKGKVYELVTDDVGDFSLELDEELEAGAIVYALTRFENAGIETAAKMTVQKGVPNRPFLINEEIRNTTTTVKVHSEEKCTVTVQVGSTKYTSSKAAYNSEEDMYLYEIEIPKTNGGTKVKIYAKNSAGTSKALTETIVQSAPNTPSTTTVKEGDKKITGTVSLILPEEDSDTEPTVNNTGTKVYAKIGGKTYEGKIKKDGSFTIQIPEQKKGAVITIWASNDRGGNGPKKVIKVAKK